MKYAMNLWVCIYYWLHIPNAKTRNICEKNSKPFINEINWFLIKTWRSILEWFNALKSPYIFVLHSLNFQIDYYISSTMNSLAILNLRTEKLWFGWIFGGPSHMLLMPIYIFSLVCFGLISHYEYSSKWLPTCIQTEHSLSFSLTNQVISCVIFHLRQPHKAVYYINLSITPRYTHCSSHI